MKTAIVIPGFKHRVQSGRGSRTYKALLGDLQAAGYKVIAITITWDRQTIADWLREAEAQLAGVDMRRALLIGFSYGAMTASVLATRHVFGRVFLCSLSPYFAEDLPRLRTSWAALAGKRRLEAFSHLQFSEVVRQYKALETIVFAGEWEMRHRKAPLLADRARAAGAQLPRATFITVPKAGHDISHPQYAAAIKAAL